MIGAFLHHRNRQQIYRKGIRLNSEIANTNSSIADKLTGTWVNAPMWRDENMTNNLYSQLSCSGCVCSMVFGFNVKNNVDGNNVCNVGYIPPAYRPATVIYCVGIMDGTTKAVLIEITTDGIVRVWGFGTNEIKAGTSITAGVTYIVSNAKLSFQYPIGIILCQLMTSGQVYYCLDLVHHSDYLKPNARTETLPVPVLLADTLTAPVMSDRMIKCSDTAIDVLAP